MITVTSRYRFGMQSLFPMIDRVELEALVTRALELADRLDLPEVGISLDGARVRLADQIIERTIIFAD